MAGRIVFAKEGRLLAMPALYRMPVFYLFVVVVVFAAALSRRPGTSPAVAPAVVEVTTPPVAVVPAVSDGILRTAEGLRRKVLVKDLAVTCRSEPGRGTTSGRALDYFAIRYVFGESPADRPRFFQVGPREGPPQGWVPASSVLEWDTRLMARPTPRSGRPRLVIYRDESCLVDKLAGRRCTRHRGACPTEGEEPETADSSTAASAESPPLGLPILESKQVDGRTIFEVASLVRDRAPMPKVAAEIPADLRPLLRRVDVAFAIDTTKSMGSAISAARKLAESVVRAASQEYQDVSLRFALVEYRDEAPFYGFRTRLESRFTDPQGFLSALRRIKAADRGDNSVDERVLDGVAQALPPSVGDLAGEHVDWPTGRAGELATKLLVLLGDAPDHARDLERATALAHRARDAGITIATVAIEQPGLSTDERTRYRQQWRTLAEESYRPLDKASGFRTPIDPLVLTLGEGDQLAGRLQALIDDRVSRARTLAALAAAEAEGRLGEYVNQQGLTLDRVAPVLVDLHKGDPTPNTRPDPRYAGRKAPSVRKGWVAERLDGQPLVTVEILMSHDELTTLIEELGQLQQAASGTPRDLAELLQIGTAAASGETSFLAADRGAITFADHLRRRQGLPPARPDSLLRRSQADLLQADDVTRAALEDRLRASLLQLTKRKNAPDWNDPRRVTEGMALVPFSAIDF